MKNKRFFLLALMMVFTLVNTLPLLAQVDDVPREETLILNAGTAQLNVPDNWNPFLPNTAINFESGLYQLAFEPFFYLNLETGETQPWLAESVEPNDDFTEWTLNLREGVTWSDGEPFTADDIVFSADVFFANPEDIGVGFVNNVSAVTKVDDYSVTFSLIDPDPNYPTGAFTSGIVAQGFRYVPQHIFENEDPTTFNNFDLERGLPLGTGPYTLVRSTPTEVVWDRDDDYWGAETGFASLPAPRRVIFSVVSTEEAAVALLTSNELDASAILSTPTFASVAANNPQLSGWFTEAPFAWFDPCTRLFQFNTEVAPFDNPEVRQAFSYAIDRDQVVAVAYGGNSLPATAPYPAYGGLNDFVQSAVDAGLYETYPVGTTDQEVARQLLEANGFAFDGTYYTLNGQPFTMEIVTANYPEIVAIGQIVAEQLQQFGIDASSRVVDPGVFDAEVSIGNIPVWIGWQLCGSTFEPGGSLGVLSNEGIEEPPTRSANVARWNNDEYSALIEEMSLLPFTDPARNELVLQAYEIYLRELPAIPLTQATKMIAFNNTYWTNWPSGSGDNYIQPPLWWQSAGLILQQIQPAGA